MTTEEQPQKKQRIDNITSEVESKAIPTARSTMMRPFITVEKKAQEALDFWKSVFTSFKLISVKHHADPHSDLIMVATFSIHGQELMMSDSPIEHEWKISPGVSFFIDLGGETNHGGDLEKQKEELNMLTEKLSGSGGKVMMPVGDYGFSKQFAWVQDKFGINWQLNIA